MPPRFIQSIAMIKQAAAKANEELDLLGSAMSKAIQASCQAIIDGEYLDQFPIDVFQTGSGTSTNMNLNEVIATLSNQILEEEKGQVQRCWPKRSCQYGAKQ